MKKILFIGLLFVLAGTGVWSQEVSDSVRIHYRRGYRGGGSRLPQQPFRIGTVYPYPAQGTGVGPSGTCRNLLVDIARRGDPLQRAACRPPCRLAEILACAPRTDSRGAGERSRRRHRLGRTTAVGGSIRYAL